LEPRRGERYIEGLHPTFIHLMRVCHAYTWESSCAICKIGDRQGSEVGRGRVGWIHISQQLINIIATIRLLHITAFDLADISPTYVY